MLKGVTTFKLRNGLLAKVKVLDIASGLCFETPIHPEEITTDTYEWAPKTTISFSPITVPDPMDWNAGWDDRGKKLRGLRGVSYMVNDLRVKKIIFSGPCTIVLWDDGTKTIARVSEGDEFDPEKGVAVCFMKRMLGHTETNKLLRKAREQYWSEQDKKGNVIDQIKGYMKKKLKGDKDGRFSNED